MTYNKHRTYSGSRQLYDMIDGPLMDNAEKHARVENSILVEVCGCVKRWWAQAIWSERRTTASYYIMQSESTLTW